MNQSEATTVTWRTQPLTTTDHQVFVNGAIRPDQDFTDIDVTQIIMDYIQDKDNSFGFLMKWQVEEPFKKLILASSEHPVAQLRPKLEVYYSIMQ